MAESGAILLGVLGCGVAVFAVDYAMSEPGESWLDQIKVKLSSESHSVPQGEGRRRTPTPKRTGPAPQRSSPRALQQPQGPQMRPQPQSPYGDHEARQSFMPKPKKDPFPLPPQTWQTPSVRRPMGDLGQASHVDEVKATATNLISKTFGGPPSSPKTKSGGADLGVQDIQRMLNTFFQGHVIEEDGKMGSLTKDAIVQFQQAQKLAATGIVDQKTHDFLVQIAAPLTTDPLAQAKRAASASMTRTGASYWTGAASGDWRAETAPLGKAAQNIIAHAMNDKDPQTQASLASALSAAGFSKASTAVAKKHGAAALPPPSTSQDFGPGF